MTLRTPAALLAGAALLSPAAAHADAWTQGKGTGRVYATAIYSHAGRSFDDAGDAVRAPDYDQYQLFLQAEYGVTDDLTLIATPSLRRVTVEGGDDGTGLGYTDLGARYRLAGGGRSVLSAQGVVRIPGTGRRDDVAQIGNKDTQFDLRLQAGRSFRVGGLEGFAIAQGGYRLRTGSPPNEWRADATLGLRATERLLVVGNLFNTWSDGRWRGVLPRYRYSTLFVGGVYDVSDRVSVQLGALRTVSGRNALREGGVYAGAWVRF